MLTKTRISLINPFNETMKTSTKKIDEKETVWFVNLFLLKKLKRILAP